MIGEPAHQQVGGGNRCLRIAHDGFPETGYSPLTRPCRCMMPARRPPPHPDKLPHVGGASSGGRRPYIPQGEPHETETSWHGARRWPPLRGTGRRGAGRRRRRRSLRPVGRAAGEAADRPVAEQDRAGGRPQEPRAARTRVLRRLRRPDEAAPGERPASARSWPATAGRRTRKRPSRTPRPSSSTWTAASGHPIINTPEHQETIQKADRRQGRLRQSALRRRVSQGQRPTPC